LAQATFSVAASGDDGYTQTSAGTYPPGGTVTVNTNGITAFVANNLETVTYIVRNGHLRFNTSSLPNDATVSAATLRLFTRASSYGDTDARNLIGEWSDPGVIDSADHTTTPGSDAFSVDLTSVDHADATYDIPLTTPTNVNLTGYTGFRIGISGGEPTGINQLVFSTLDHTTQAEPVLIVEYTAPSSGDLLLLGIG
jgi:hypothetical protein